MLTGREAEAGMEHSDFLYRAEGSLEFILIVSRREWPQLDVILGTRLYVHYDLSSKEQLKMATTLK